MNYVLSLVPPCVYEEWLAHLWEFSREGLSESLAERRN